MKRTQIWWNRLTPDERSRLVWLERSANKLTTLGGYLPDDCGECPSCSEPVLGGGLCRFCSNELDQLLAKADKESAK